MSLSGQVIALAGRLSQSSAEYARQIAARGGTFSKDVTKRTTKLVVAHPEHASSKVDKARAYGTEVIDEAALRALLDAADPADAPEAAPDAKVMGNAPPCLLAKTYDAGRHREKIRGWLVSEKLDGVRAWWDGTSFWSRTGHRYHAPEWFTAAMPPGVTLDGELYQDRGQFQETVSIVRNSAPDARWERIRYMVFDAPSLGELPFRERLACLPQLLVEAGSVARVVEHTELADPEGLPDLLERVEAAGGEGLMLRDPQSKYEGKRSQTLLKVKSFRDDEARVVAHETGTRGRLKGVVASLCVEGRDGTRFKVGSGLTDADRRSPPAVGTIITYRYQELTGAGKPRFPTYVGPAIDKTFP